MAYPTPNLLLSDRIGVEMMSKINSHFGDSAQHTGGTSGGTSPIKSAADYGITPSASASQNRTGLLSLAGSSAHVYFPPGDYAVGNSAGKVDLGTFSGVLDFAPGAHLLFSDVSKGGLSFGAGTCPIINNLSASYTTTPTTRVGGQNALGFSQTINPLLINYHCDGSPSIGVAFELCERPRIIHAYITNTMADGCMFSNSADSCVIDYTAEDTGDDGLSFLNHSTGADNRGGYASGVLIRRGKARGIAIVGAKDITLENALIDGTDGEGIIVAEDPTYSTRIPENVAIRNSKITGAGSISGLGLTPENGIGFNHALGLNTIENVLVEDSGDSGVYVATMGADSHINIRGVTVSRCASNGFFCQINPSVHIESCEAILCDSSGFNLLANYRLTFHDLTATNCSLTDTDRRAFEIGQADYGGNTFTTCYVDGDGLQIYDDQATPTGYRIFLYGVSGFAITGDVGTIRSFCRVALPNYVTSTSGANMSVTRQVVHSGSQSSGGTAAPTGGYWRVGEIVWNSAPTAGGNIGWVCTAQGNPGTWKAFGTIAA